MIVQELRRLQERDGYLKPAELMKLSQRIATPLYRLQEVASFFPLFRFEAPAKVQVEVCRDMACHLRGSRELLQSLEAQASSLPAGQVCVKGVSCVGRCDRAPAVRMNDHNYVQRSAEELATLLRQSLTGQLPPADDDANYLPHGLRKIDGTVPSWTIDIDHGKPGYRSVRQFVNAKDREAERGRILKALETGGLLGMGGAGGRAYKKWGDVRQAVGREKYVVCNGDESEPGTFKDREILLRAPHLVIEGMILGGLVIGAERGYVYIRHEYEEQIAAVEQAIRDAQSLGVLGRNLLESGLNFELEVFVSPGGYICGEQTALIEAMEDRRGEPRNRPPELQTNGFRDQPTLLNNVETLAWVPAIVVDEGAWFAAQGIKPAKGRRLFSISGDVYQPGVYEVPNGIRLGELLEMAGGVRGGAMKAFAPSGPSGGLLPALLPVAALNPKFTKTLSAGTTHFDLRDWPLDIAVSRQMGLMLGAGLVVYGEGADLVREALANSEFFRNESCGKCVPCRLGSQKIVELGTQLVTLEFDQSRYDSTRELILELSEAMKETSICGLGEVASNPVTSLMQFFPEEVQRYLKK